MTREPEHDAKAAQERLIELGWLIVTELDPFEQAAVAQGRARMLERLREQFGRFEWRMPVVQRPESLIGHEVEPAELLQEGVEERDLRHWDFVFVVTRTDLSSRIRSSAGGGSAKRVSTRLTAARRVA